MAIADDLIGQVLAVPLFVKVKQIPFSVMCPGFEEWWLYKMGFKFPKLVIFIFCAQIMLRRFFVDTMYVHMYVLCKPAGN